MGELLAGGGKLKSGGSLGGGGLGGGGGMQMGQEEAVRTFEGEGGTLGEGCVGNLRKQFTNNKRLESIYGRPGATYGSTRAN